MEDNKANKEMNVQQPAMMPAKMPMMPMVPMMCCPCVMVMQCPMMCGQHMMGMPPTAVSPFEMKQQMSDPFMTGPFGPGPMSGPDMHSAMHASMMGTQY